MAILWRGAQEGGQSQTTTVLIPDIYFCLFSLGPGLHGSNFCRDETEQGPWGVHYRERASAPPPHPPHSTQARRDSKGPGGWFGSVGGVDGTYRVSVDVVGGESGGWGWGLEEAERKDTVNI